jgi:osmotically-inducible protein OsmY
MNDRELQQDVSDELEFEPSVDAAHIGVTARDGVVTLTGFVSSIAEKDAAERVARRVKGVRGIAQEIEVRVPSDKKQSDEEIAARALEYFKWDVGVPADRIRVKVEKGVVTLIGDVDWQYQKSEAELDARKLSGVMGVINQIVVKPIARPTDIKEKIEKAFARNAELEASHIDVTVDGNKVVLSGTVRAWFERDIAQRAAWSAPGVTEVHDHITIEA